MKERTLPSRTYFSHSFLSTPTVAYALVAGSILSVLGVIVEGIVRWITC